MSNCAPSVAISSGHPAPDQHERARLQVADHHHGPDQEDLVQGARTAPLDGVEDVCARNQEAQALEDVVLGVMLGEPAVRRADIVQPRHRDADHAATGLPGPATGRGHHAVVAAVLDDDAQAGQPRGQVVSQETGGVSGFGGARAKDCGGEVALGGHGRVAYTTCDRPRTPDAGGPPLPPAPPTNGRILIDRMPRAIDARRTRLPATRVGTIRAGIRSGARMTAGVSRRAASIHAAHPTARVRRSVRGPTTRVARKRGG